MRELLVESVEKLLAQEVDEVTFWAAFATAGFDRLFTNDADASLGDGLALVSAVASHLVTAPAAEALLVDFALRGVCVLPEGVTATFATDDAIALIDGRLHGVARRVPWARRCDMLLSYHGGGEIFALSRLSDGIVTQGLNLAGEPRDDVTMKGVAPIATGPAPIARRTFAALAALFRSAQMVGAIGSVLALAMHHARGREQFGKPIAAFQAVQHLIAGLVMEAEAARAAIARAERAESDEEVVWCAGVAKTRIGASATIVAATAHQILGAMGVSREHDLHRFTRRLWAWRDECGAERAWAAELGRDICARGGAALWPAMTGVLR